MDDIYIYLQQIPLHTVPGSIYMHRNTILVCFGSQIIHFEGWSGQRQTALHTQVKYTRKNIDIPKQITS